MQALFEWDRAILRQINAVWHNSFFDWLMPFLRNADMWIPLYFFMLLFGVVNYKKTGWWWILLGVVTVVVSDFVSSDIIKQNIHRLRPCNDPALSGWLRLIPGISFPQSSSFTSSHAANHFAMAMFFYFTLKSEIGQWAGLFFVWAAAICYAQMYVGVHYPVDIICGGIIGLLIGYGTGSLFNKRLGLA